MYTIRCLLLGVLSFYFLATDAVAAERNPVRSHPSTTLPSPDQGILVRLRPAAAASAHKQTLAVEARMKRTAAAASTTAAGAATSGSGTIAAVSAAVPTLQALASRSALTYKQSREISSGLHLLQVQSGESPDAVLAHLRADPDVLSAEPDLRRYPHSAPNDPVYTEQWYMQAVQPSATNAVAAWDTTTGRSDIVIAELDTGVRFDHPDLLQTSVNGRLLPGYDFVTNAAVANDGDGRDADPSDPGDYVTSADTQTSQFSGCDVTNSSWHGTRVAGILGAKTNNAVGIAGMTWLPKILPLRVLGKCGGVDSDILDAMRWAAGLHVTGVPDNAYPAEIINLSLGSQGLCTSAQQSVISEVIAKGTLVVISAGNDGSTVDSPADCTGVVAVAGLRNTGTKVGFSNLGPSVTISAPGGNCVNTVGGCQYSLDTTFNTGTTTPGTNGYTDELNNPNVGTSFSSPIVAGIAGLMTSVNSNLKPSQLLARLREGATAFPTNSSVSACHVPASSSDTQTSECNCTTSTCGAGMANAVGALHAALRPIAAIQLPTSVSAGQNVSISGAASGTACNRSIVTYAWTNVSNSNNAIQGANTSTATIVAPSSGSVTIRLTVTDDAGRTDTADVTVSSTSATSAAPSAANTGSCTVAGVIITPTTSSVRTGTGTQTFTATVQNSTNTSVTWSVNNVEGGNSMYGTITAAGVYTAPAAVPSPATVTVTATSVGDATQSASAQVTITPPISVSVTPLLANVVVGATQTFTATVTNASSTTVTWSVNGVPNGNATVGTISDAGVYTAPSAVPTPATVSVTAVASADSSRSGSAQTTVVATSNDTSGSGTGTSTGGSGTGTSGGSGSSTSSGSGGGGAFDLVTLVFFGGLLVSLGGRRVRVCRRTASARGTSSIQ